MTLNPRPMRNLFLLFLLLGVLQPAFAQSPSYLYRVSLVRASPGHMLDLIDLYKAQMTAYAAVGDEAPFWMRHSQGDQWDLMLIYPMESLGTYYHPDRITQRMDEAGLWTAFAEQRAQITARQEDLWAYGPDLDVVRQAFDSAGFFHVEMFEALPGKHAELYHQREMENAYLAALNRPQNLIFKKAQGISVDVFTLGFYRDIKHFGESADIPLEDEDRAAKAAGFESVYHISPYLRALIREHHDTLAVAIR